MKKNSLKEKTWLLKTTFIIYLILLLPLFGTTQSLGNEEVLRHFKKDAKLVPHIYDQDTSTWGYIFGHNVFYDYEWAEKYQIEGGALVIGTIAHIIGTNPNKEKTANFSIYEVHKDMKPGTSLHYQSTTYDKINIDGSETHVLFDSSVYVRDSFFVAFGVFDYAHDPTILDKDTLYLLATEEGTRDEDDLKVFGRNCIRTHSIVPELGWIDVFTQDRKSVNAYLAIFPIMDFSSSSKSTQITNGTVHFSKSFYNKPENTIYSEIVANKQEEADLSLTTFNGKEINRIHVTLTPNQKKIIPLKIPSTISKGNYIIIVSGKTFKLAQKVAIY